MPGYRLGVYPGSFDPPTLGHLDIVERAIRLFDEIVVAVGVNSGKSPFLTIDERLEALRASTSHIPRIKIETFEGLLVDYAGRLGATAIVRGLRATSDFDYEFQIAMANRQMAPQIDTVVLLTKWEYSFLSSSVVREVATLGGDISTFVPPEVKKIVESKLSRR